MTKMKYVMYDNNKFVLLPTSMSHDDVPHYGVVSAGFAFLETTPDGNCIVETHGKSVSLNKESRPQDAEIMSRDLSPNR